MNLGDKILADGASSYWLKRAIGDLAQRDPLDALNDVQALLAVCEERMAALEVL